MTLLLVMLGVALLAELLGGGWPSPLGWSLAPVAVPALWSVDVVHKLGRARRRRAQP